MADSPAHLVQRQYTRRVAIALVVIIAVWHATNDLFATLGGRADARAPLVPPLLWLIFAAMAGWHCVRLLHRDRSPRLPWLSGAVLLGLAVAGDLAVGPGQLL